MISAAKVAAIALNAIPGVGQGLYLAAGAGLEIYEQVDERHDAQEELGNFKQQVASGEVQVYDQKISDVMHDLAGNASYDTMMKNIIVAVSVQLATAPIGGAATKYAAMPAVETVLGKMAIHLTHAQAHALEGIIDGTIHHMMEHTTMEQVHGHEEEKLEEAFHHQMDENVVAPSFKSIH